MLGRKTEEPSVTNRVYGPVIFIGIVEDASQTLDGFGWTNVTFINMRIRYRGGDTELHNVRFVNCTFDFPNDQKGNQMVSDIAIRSALTSG